MPFGRFRGAIICRYLAYKMPGTNHFLRLPMVHVRLVSPQASLSTIGLVDSGSTTTFIPFDLADILSLPKVKEDSAIGAGGRFKAFIAKVDISIMKGSSAFATFKDFPAYVPYDPEAIPYVVLGRDSIFRKFDISFRENKQRVIFRHPSR